jgi:hypothetical protein
MPLDRHALVTRPFDIGAPRWLLVGSMVLSFGCSGTETGSSQEASAGGATGASIVGGNKAASGGASPVGGTSSAVGGSKAAGGSSTSAAGGTLNVTAGTKTAGGAVSASSVTGSGGAKPSGGAFSAGGVANSGGASNFKSTEGGGHATGGSPAASGGANDTGGTVSVGGSRVSGGASGTGGVVSTGGNKASATGGTKSTSTGPVTTTCPGAIPAGYTSAFCSCDQWGEFKSGDYTYYNDIWGSGAGSQCIWVAATGEWGVAANHPNTSGIKSYPNISLSPAKVISSINSYTSTFDVTVPSSGAYEAAYDLWVKGTTSSRIEIMLWTTYRGGVAPIASAYNSSGAVADKSNVSVSGHTWNVYYGSNGSNDVVSFLRTSNTNTGTIDIKAVLDWIIANNKSKYAVFTASWTLDQVQFGYEISSDGSAQSFVTNAFSVTSN